jgi:hypothetical protein
MDFRIGRERRGTGGAEGRIKEIIMADGYFSGERFHHEI